MQNIEQFDQEFDGVCNRLLNNAGGGEPIKNTGKESRDDIELSRVE